jgi:hypothetical protein
VYRKTLHGSLWLRTSQTDDLLQAEEKDLLNGETPIPAIGAPKRSKSLSLREFLDSSRRVSAETARRSTY